MTTMRYDIEAILQLARPAVRAVAAYENASWDPTLERLHANESPWPPEGADPTQALHRYPEPQPKALVQAFAQYCGVDPGCVLLGRGSDEGIDLLTRAFCEAGKDAVLITPPTFGMYAVAARIQGAYVVEIPLQRNAGYALDAVEIAGTARTGYVNGQRLKILWLCSPNNPTGNAIATTDLERILDAAGERAIVVVDEAYGEFTAQPSWASRIAEYPQLVVLRTLSKAHGLAGARLGAVIAHPRIIALLRKIVPPYAIASQSAQAALAALQPSALEAMRSRVRLLLAERLRVATALAATSKVLKVWPSDANFLLVEFRDANAALVALAAERLVVRDFRGKRGIGAGALRITIGTPEQNDRLIRSLT